MHFRHIPTELKGIYDFPCLSHLSVRPCCNSRNMRENCARIERDLIIRGYQMRSPPNRRQIPPDVRTTAGHWHIQLPPTHTRMQKRWETSHHPGMSRSVSPRLSHRKVLDDCKFIANTHTAKQRPPSRRT